MNYSAILTHHARSNPQGQALRFQSRVSTWAEWNERVDALAYSLRQLGVERNDVVAILSYNCLEFLDMGLAANRLGAIFLPLNWRLSSRELAYILRDSTAKALFWDPFFKETVEKACAEVAVPISISFGPGQQTGIYNILDLIEQGRGGHVPDSPVTGRDIHRLMYTSGTTSMPKGVVLTYENLHMKSLAHIVQFNITKNDIMLVSGPLYHVGGMDLTTTATFTMGGQLIVLRQFNVDEVLDAIQTYHVTSLWLAPTMVNMVMARDDLDRFNLSSVRYIINGGEKMPVPLIRRIQQAFPNAWFSDAYGLTETFGGDTFMDVEHVIEKIGSVGKPCMFTEVQIVDPQGNPLSDGQQGEIRIRGPKVSPGYWHNADATNKAMREGWFYTGDIGYVDEDGYLYITDRIKDIIISGGENISSLDVERVLYEHPAVFEVAVVAKPDPRWGEVPVAFIVPRDGMTVSEKEIQEFCHDKLARFKIPRQVILLDALPRNPSGKVLKRELRGYFDNKLTGAVE